jgi:hypothetical protein
VGFIGLGPLHIDACLLDGRWVIGRQIARSILPLPPAPSHPDCCYNLHVAIGLHGMFSLRGGVAMEVLG